MKMTTVTQSDKSEFVFKVGEAVKLVSSKVMTYLKVDQVMIIENISKRNVFFRNPGTSCGTYESAHMLAHMTFVNAN